MGSEFVAFTLPPLMIATLAALFLASLFVGRFIATGMGSHADPSGDPHE